jgi:hypothetical protein
LEENKMSNNNIVYLEVCYGNIDSICIRATKKLSKADAQYYTINDALKLGFEIKHVTRIIELSKEEAYGAFDMERKTPVFEPRYKR